MIIRIIFIALLVSLGSSPADAKGNYFTTKTILKEFFPSSKRVTYSRFTPSSSVSKAISKRLGYPLARKSYIFYIAMTGQTIDGYAFIDNQQGQHQPITFAVKLSTSGTVLRQEIMVYREQRGDEVRDPRFRKQFRGKSADDSVRVGKDIDTISGATISSKAITLGVKRTLVLFDEAFVKSDKLVSSVN